MSRLLALFAFLLLHHGVVAQTVSITGSVVDTSGMPIYNATVVLMQNDTVAYGTITNSNGHFAFQAKKGIYTLSVSRMGYQVWNDKVDAKADTRLNMIVLYEGILLDEVSVKANKRSALATADGLVYTVNERDAKNSINAYHLLSKVPELQVNKSDHSIGVVGSNNTLIMVNGVRREPIIVQSLKPTDIEKIEVISNPSVKYLSEDITSVVNIITRERVRGLSGEVAQMVTVPNIKTSGWTDVSLTGNTDKMSLYLIGYLNYGAENRTKRRDTTRTVVGDISFASISDSCMDSNFPSFEINAGGDFKLAARTRLTFDAFFNYDAFKESYTTNRQMFQNGLNVRTDIIGYNQKGNEQKQKYAAYLQHLEADSSGQYDVEFIYADYLYNDNAKNEINSTLGSSAYSLCAKSHQQTFHFQAEYGHKLWGGNIAAGYRARHQRISQLVDDPDVGNAENAKYVEWKHYPYLRYNGSIGKHFTYRVGIGSEFTSFVFTPEGYEKASNRYTKPLPSLSAQYATQRAGAFGIYYSASLQRVEIQQLNPAIISLDTLQFRQGNPKLEPFLYHSIGLRYTLSKGDFYLYPYVNYRWAQNSIVNIVDVQPNGTIKNTYKAAAFYSLTNPAVYSKCVINDMWELSGSIGYNIYRYKDDKNLIDRSLSGFNWDASITCYVGDFCIEASAFYTGKYLTGDYVGVAPFDSRIQVDWQFAKGWNAGIELRYLTPWYISGTVERPDYYNHIRIERIDRYLRPSFSISYSFEYGSSREQTEKRIQSTIDNEKLSL